METSSHEKYRPQVHFSPAQNWMDGPSGLVFLDGEYHLFYKYNTTGTSPDPRHWGHAVSTDLIHWNELPVALSPEGDKSISYGSVVVDVRNTSGLGTIDNPPLVAIYTLTDQTEDAEGQFLAYSLDKGNTWTTFGDDPVIANLDVRDFRDPKVFWYEPTARWVMVVASAERRIRIFTSPDLKEWTYASDFGQGLDVEENTWERPDLFELPVANGEGTQWILTLNVGLGAHNEWMTAFFAGGFDGKSFTTTQTAPYGVDYGKDNYGGVTFNNLPGGRRVLIGWANNWEYAEKAPASTSWRGSFTLPRDLHLEKMPYYYILASQPVEERTTLYGKTAVVKDLVVTQDINTSGFADVTSMINFPLLPAELNIRFETENRQIGFAEKFGVKLSNKAGEYILAGYDAYHQQFYIDRSHSTLLNLPDKYAGVHIQRFQDDGSGIIEIQLILDATSIELFAEDGKVTLTDVFYPASEYNKLEVFAENGRIRVEKLTVTQLKTILEQ
jgi:fructan beta-fructosidase